MLHAYIDFDDILMQAGGVMVDRNAGVVLKAKLELSRFNDDESITRMIQDFEAKVSI
jgi:hypothetical protein